MSNNQTVENINKSIQLKTELIRDLRNSGATVAQYIDIQNRLMSLYETLLKAASQEIQILSQNAKSK